MRRKDQGRSGKEENMPLWDSVQRGLEKASQEAARIARTQRLRNTLDGLTRQANTQSNNLIDKALELFTAGQLTQSELLPICQELTSLRQQINDAQMELKQIQASQPPAAATTGQVEGPVTYPPTMPMSIPYTPAESSGDLPPTIYAPPPPGYQSYLESVGGDVTAPPPPYIGPLTISSMETVMMGTDKASSPATPAVPQAANQTCPACRTEIQPGHAFCSNCGTPVQNSDALQLPTMRASAAEPAYAGDQGTVRAGTAEAPYMGGDETVRADAPFSGNATPAPVQQPGTADASSSGE
jgi:hypothetical protein